MNKNLLDLEEHLKSFEERSQKEIDDLQSKVDVANESREKLAEDYIIAREKLDTKSFTKISEEMRSLKDVIELYEDKIEQLKATPVVSKEEYKAMKDSILETLKSEDEKAQVKVNKLLAEADTLREELTHNIGKGNTLLHRLQRVLYKEPKIVKVQNDDGRTLKTASRDDKFLLNDSAMHTLNKILQAKK